MGIRNLPRSIFGWFKQWWWVLILIIMVVVATIYAYQLSDEAQPIDAVATAGPLVLSVFLVYLYSRQNIIQERQQEILESQHEVQQAVEVTPKLHPTWNLRENGDKLYLKLENNSAADVYNLNLVTEMTVSLGSEFEQWVQSSEGIQFSGSIRRFPLTKHFGEREVGEFNENLRFNFSHARSDPSTFQRITTSLLRILPWESSKEEDSLEELSFNKLSRTLVKETRSKGYDGSIHLLLDGRLEYEDSTGKSHETVIFSGPVEFDGSAYIRRRDDSVEAITRRPQFEIENIDIKRANSGNQRIGFKDDSIGVTIQNVGDELGIISGVGILCNIIEEGHSATSGECYTNGTSKSSFSGEELPAPHLEVGINDSELLIHPLRFRFQSADEDRAIKLFDLTKVLIEDKFRFPVEVRITIEYQDSVGNNYSLSRSLLRFIIGGESLEQANDTTFVGVTEPVSAGELFDRVN